MNKITEAGVVHAQWCGHCKSMIDDWNKFAGKGQHGGIQIKTYDESDKKHESDGIKADGFPTFYSKDASGNVNTSHSVERTFGGFEKWFDEMSGGSDEMSGGKKKTKKKKTTKTTKKKTSKKKTTKKKTAKKKTAKKKTTKKKNKLFFGLF
tara:strand:- start:4153 stop:4605 length:453 start_codon:yes stop_codon:yes gene_type:complete